MQTFGFEEEVRRRFSFLLEHGFAISESNSTQVIYATKLYELEIYYGPHSNEIDLAVNSVPRSKFGSCSSKVLIAAFNFEASRALPPSSVIRTREAMVDRVQELADYFKKYVDLNAFKSPALGRQLESIGKNMFDTRYPNVSWSQMRTQFEVMWRNKEFGQLVALFDCFRDRLTKDEIEKLEQARSGLTRANKI